MLWRYSETNEAHSPLINRAGGVENPTRKHIFYDFARCYGDIKNAVEADTASKPGKLLFYYIGITTANIGLENHTGFSLVTTLQQKWFAYEGK